MTPLTDAERKGLQRTKEFFTQGSGYSAEHSTKPQTLGYSLADSPIGLLAWIYEKLVTWTDDYPWTDDEGVSKFGLVSCILGDSDIFFQCWRGFRHTGSLGLDLLPPSESTMR